MARQTILKKIDADRKGEFEQPGSWPVSDQKTDQETGWGYLVRGQPGWITLCVDPSKGLTLQQPGRVKKQRGGVTRMKCKHKDFWVVHRWVSNPSMINGILWCPDCGSLTLGRLIEGKWELPSWKNKWAHPRLESVSRVVYLKHPEKPAIESIRH